jgi:hypothetical protein
LQHYAERQADTATVLALSLLRATNPFSLSAVIVVVVSYLRGVGAHDLSGFCVSDAGDISGDGIDDPIIGAKGAYPYGIRPAGESYAVFGRTTGFPASFEPGSLFYWFR